MGVYTKTTSREVLDVFMNTDFLHFNVASQTIYKLNKQKIKLGVSNLREFFPAQQDDKVAYI